MSSFTILVMVLLGVGVLGYMYWQRRRNQNAKQWVEPQLVWSRATVLSSEIVSPPSSLSGRARVELKLQVRVPGSDPYEAQTTWSVDEDALEYLKPNEIISIKVDMQKPAIIHPDAPWAVMVTEK
jgi:hypothetical protein